MRIMHKGVEREVARRAGRNVVQNGTPRFSKGEIRAVMGPIQKAVYIEIVNRPRPSSPLWRPPPF